MPSAAPHHNKKLLDAIASFQVDFNEGWGHRSRSLDNTELRMIDPSED